MPASERNVGTVPVPLELIRRTAISRGLSSMNGTKVPVPVPIKMLSPTVLDVFLKYEYPTVVAVSVFRSMATAVKELLAA